MRPNGAVHEPKPERTLSLNRRVEHSNNEFVSVKEAATVAKGLHRTSVSGSAVDVPNSHAYTHQHYPPPSV